MLATLLHKLRKRGKTFKNHPLAKNNVLGAYIRYIQFNLIQFIWPKKRVYKWIEGLRFYAERGDAGIVANIYVKLHDYEDSMFLLNMLKENELFVDVGANVGHFSLLAAGVNKANVVALEPIASTFKKLCDNVMLNKLSSKVECLQIGAGEQKGKLAFIQNETVKNRVALKPSSQTLEVPVVTLDELLEGKTPVCIKIDVEGFEYFVLKGAEKTLQKKSLKYLIVEFNNSGLQYNVSNEMLFNLIASHNFIPVTYKGNVVKEAATFNKEKFNTLFIRKNPF